MPLVRAHRSPALCVVCPKHPRPEQFQPVVSHIFLRPPHLPGAVVVVIVAVTSIICILYVLSSILTLAPPQSSPLPRFVFAYVVPAPPLLLVHLSFIITITSAMLVLSAAFVMCLPSRLSPWMSPSSPTTSLHQVPSRPHQHVLDLSQHQHHSSSSFLCQW